MSKFIKIEGGFEEKYGITSEEGFLNIDAITFYKKAEYDPRHGDFNNKVTILLPCGSWFFTRMNIEEFEKLLNDAQFNEKFKKEIL